jgi:hypothetical protein
VKENMMVELKKRRHSLRMVEFILQDVISLWWIIFLLSNGYISIVIVSEIKLITSL